MRQKAQEENTHTDYGKSIYILEVHGEQRGMGYGLHLPRTSQVGNQVHQDDQVNEAVRDAFGVRDDNFTAKCEVRTVFFRNDAAREFFSLMDESDHPLYQGLPKLEVLILGNNKFYGAITSSNTKHPFSKLRIFDISDNYFNASLPEAFIKEFKGLHKHEIEVWRERFQLKDSAQGRRKAPTTEIPRVILRVAYILSTKKRVCGLQEMSVAIKLADYKCW
ncbi:hypothetical protein K1719_002861 [Acacia pycnantha]|nr:hypothetical protein K1719_002861 [Acacia pycnantha]